ncbi:MAG: adenosine deaminase [Candidatus Aquirickettsiella gammari]
MKIASLVFLITLFSSLTVAAETRSERATSHYFASIQSHRQKLAIFLHDMPKGADLHNHLGGASRAENMLRYAEPDLLCVNGKNFAVQVNPRCTRNYLLAESKKKPALYNAIIDAWSMRNFHPGKESGHDHFFATFDKYLPILQKHRTEMLREVVEKACQENLLYLELMIMPDNNRSGLLASKMAWDANLSRLREKLLKNGLMPIIADISSQLESYDKKLNTIGRIKGKNTCADFKLRYLYQVLREQPPVQVFAQLLTGFELATRDPRVVGLNLVQAEDGPIAMRDYTLQMQMVKFLHHLYPKVAISLHAGELVPGLVPTQDLRFHIRQAVEIAHADRIGHGVDIRYEDNAEQLLSEMAKRHILVEINLSSNAAILNIKANTHPLLFYRRYRVPLALSTDDEGILRTSLSEQYQIAVLNYRFSYLSLKKLARNSIQYSFLPGAKLWQDDNYQQVVLACVSSLKTSLLSADCQNFLNANQKADLQWKLEQQFRHFEQQFSKNSR